MKWFFSSSICIEAHNFVASFIVIFDANNKHLPNPKKYFQWTLINIFSSTIGSNVKHTKKHGDKWYKVIEHNIDTNECCSDLDENELTDEEDLNNNNVNNQSLLSSYTLNENASIAHSNCVRDFFDCLRFRRNYKRNRKKYGKGQSRLSNTYFS